MICQFIKYLEKFYVDVTILFNDNPLQDPKFSLKIMEILITKGNLTMIPKEATEEHLNDLSRKRKAIGTMTYTPTRGEQQYFPYSNIHHVLYSSQ